MPKATFQNLPAAKRQAIIDLALEEFAERPYHLASLSRIVERAGIAKGSIYQYFDHKQDLYLFIVGYAAQAQLRLLAELDSPDPGLDLFALLRWQMGASVRVGLAAPALVRLMHRATTDDLPFRDEVLRLLHAAGGEHLRLLLARAQERGEIDSALDLDLAAYIVGRVTGDLHELLVRRLGTTLDAAAADPAALDNPAAWALYDQVVRVLQFGLSAGARPPSSGGAER